MRSLFLVLLLCTFSLSTLAQDDYRSFNKYSYKEFIEMIANEPSGTFELSNAFVSLFPTIDELHLEELDTVKPIVFKSDTLFWPSKKEDLDTLSINKELILDNVIFQHWFHSIEFTEAVHLNNTTGFVALNCTFNKEFNFTITEEAHEYIFRELNTRPDYFHLQGSKFNQSFSFQTEQIQNSLLDKKKKLQVNFLGNEFSGISFYLKDAQGHLEFFSNHFNNLHYPPQLISENGFKIRDNNFNHRLTRITLSEGEFISNEFYDNRFENLLYLNYQSPNNVILKWQDIDDKVIFRSSENITDYTFLDEYYDSIRIADELIFNEEIAMRGRFLNYFRKRFNLKEANSVYSEMKRLETDRLSFEYYENPNFDTYFSWKVNQFLEVFSSFGTRPARAVIVSLYVIILFGLFYLFFPNSWDEKGKHRILNRFRYFNKYLLAPSGMHELYLQEKESQVVSYKQFKEEISKSNMELPKFFVRWAKPVYHLSMINTRLSSGLLKSTDILSGKWADLPPAKRRWKNIQIGTFLIFGLLWDLLVRMLNALMLSVNTFTTLGFGEIPIKGIPRYLAIIQGFIGWFMLTIFSVSLISQLLS